LSLLRELIQKKLCQDESAWFCLACQKGVALKSLEMSISKFRLLQPPGSAISNDKWC